MGEIFRKKKKDGKEQECFQGENNTLAAVTVLLGSWKPLKQMSYDTFFFACYASFHSGDCDYNLISKLLSIWTVLLSVPQIYLEGPLLSLSSCNMGND